MPRATTALRLAYAALAASDAVLAGSAAPRAHRVRRVTKPLLVPVLAASMATDPRTHDSPLRTTTRAGQALGWLGDIALLGRGSGAFVAGMAAFGAGQAAYIRGFRTVRDPEPLSRSVIGRSAALLFAVSGPPMAYGAARHDPVLGPGVLAYPGLLTAMAAHAAHLDPAPRGCPAGQRPRRRRLPHLRHPPRHWQICPRRGAPVARIDGHGDLCRGPISPSRRCPSRDGSGRPSAGIGRELRVPNRAR